MNVAVMPLDPNMKTNHPRFDIPKYLSNVLSSPLAEVERKMSTSSGIDDLIDQIIGDRTSFCFASLDTGHGGPLGIVMQELMVRLLKDKIQLGRGVPMDYLVWRKTPHEFPWLSRIGGMPWRDRSLPWPRSQKGDDYTFVGQFNLSDTTGTYSYDFSGDLVLIFFAFNEAMYGGEGDIILEWSTKELANPLSKQDCPPAGFPVPELFAELHRTLEYPDFNYTPEIFDQIYDLVPASKRVGWDPVPEITRIGTTEHNGLQGNLDDEPLLFALGCFSPSYDWPFPDRKEPLQGRGHDQWFDGDRIIASGGPVMYVQSADGQSLAHRTS